VPLPRHGVGNGGAVVGGMATVVVVVASTR
jgi:hypothetical protein